MTAMPAPTPPNDVPPIAIIVSRYNQSITHNLRDGAARAYAAAGGRESDLAIIEVPGTFELPVLAQEAALSGAYNAIVALGCVIRGETDHDRYIADAVVKALLDVSLETGIPVALGVLTTSTIEQAVERSGGHDGTAPGNKGAEAMIAALGTVDAIGALLEVEEPGVSPGVRFALSATVPDKGVAPAAQAKSAPARPSRPVRTRSSAASRTSGAKRR